MCSELDGWMDGLVWSDQFTTEMSIGDFTPLALTWPSRDMSVQSRHQWWLHVALNTMMQYPTQSSYHNIELSCR